LSTGNGTLTGTTPQTTDGSGVAAFTNLSIELTGTKNLTASSGALNSAVSAAFTISPDAASELDYVQQPSTATAGVAIAPEVTVRARDIFGNTVPGVSVGMSLNGTG